MHWKAWRGWAMAVGLGFALGGPLAAAVAVPAAAAMAADPAPAWRYGMLAAYPPFQIWPARGWPGGADLDLLQAAARARGGTIEPVRYTDVAALIDDLAAGRIDVASAMSRTPERELSLAFGPAYAQVEQVMVVRAADGNVPLMPDLAGRRIAVVPGYASATQSARLFPLAARVDVADVEAGLRALGEGRADLFIESTPVILETLDRLGLPDLRLTRTVVLGSGMLHLVAGRAHAAQLAPLADAVQALGEDERLAAIERWTAVSRHSPPAHLPLTPAERAALLALPPLTVAVVDAQAPFSMAGASGQPVGLAVETLAAALGHLGLPPPIWRLMPADAALAALRDGTADLGLGLPEGVSRASGIGHAGPFIEHPLVLVARSGSGLWSLEQMAGRRLAMPALQVPQTLLLSRFPRVLPVACATVADCLRRVERGEADAATADVVSLALVLAGGGYGDLQIVGTAGDLRHARGVAISPAQRPLAPLLQRALDVAVAVDLPGLKRHWLERPPPRQMVVVALRRMAPWLLAGGALLALLWWWHSAGLRAQVARTQAAQREAERAAAASNRFITFLAHEVRNSLHSVIAATELLRGEKGVAPAVAEPLGHSARGTLALLNGLLDRERLAAGALTLDPAPARLGLLVRAVVQEMGPAARLAGVTVQLLPSPDPLLRLDALRVQQVVRNLLSNAIKYAGPGEVQLAWRIDPEGVDAADSACRVTLTLSDHGPGLAKGQQATLFKPYFNGAVHGAGLDRADSAGLGLALSRDLARAHGGDLTIISPPGGGVEAQFTLLAEALAEPAAAPQPAAPSAPRRALVVEDAEVYALMLQRALEAAGWSAECVGTVVEARARLAAAPFELLLTDLHLPDGGASEVLEAAVRPGLRRVVMSAELDVQTRAIPGADAVLAKQADVQAFIARVLGAVAAAPSA